MKVGSEDTPALSLAGEPAGRRAVASAESSTGPPLPTVLVAGFGGAMGAGLCEVLTRHGALRVLCDDGAGDLSATIDEQRPDVVLVNEEALRGALELRRLTSTYPQTGLVVA